MRAPALPTFIAAKVSLLIPCYEAHAFVGQAIQSALDQSYANIEIIVSPDDGQSYEQLLTTFNTPKLRVLPAGNFVRTGAGAARNRAIDAATGDFFAMLDADDLISPNYIAELLKIANEDGAAVAPTRYLDWENREVIRAPKLPDQSINLDSFSKVLASIHPLIHRSLEIGYCDGFAQDVIHDGWVFATLGEVQVVHSSSYDIRQRDGSACNGANAEAQIQQAYELRIRQILHTQTALQMQTLSVADRTSFAKLFEFRAYVSRAFAASSELSYNAWLANKEDHLWQEFSINTSENVMTLDRD
jgi:glycosyltransferase involved in cell wall biosynthesis